MDPDPDPRPSFATLPDPDPRRRSCFAVVRDADPHLRGSFTTIFHPYPHVGSSLTTVADPDLHPDHRSPRGREDLRVALTTEFFFRQQLKQDRQVTRLNSIQPCKFA
jgi:hypothetical protein